MKKNLHSLLRSAKHVPLAKHHVAGDLCKIFSELVRSESTRNQKKSTKQKKMDST